MNKGKVARDQLACTKQEESEPVRKYVQRMREIFLKIPSITEDEKLDRFVRNLRLVIREKVDMHNPRTFDEAASRAERIDATWNQIRKEKNMLTSATWEVVVVAAGTGTDTGTGTATTTVHLWT